MLKGCKGIGLGPKARFEESVDSVSGIIIINLKDARNICKFLAAARGTPIQSIAALVSLEDLQKEGPELGACIEFRSGALRIRAPDMLS